MSLILLSSRPQLPRLFVKEVAGPGPIWYQLSTCWSVGTCLWLRLFKCDTGVPADCMIVTTSVINRWYSTAKFLLCPSIGFEWLFFFHLLEFAKQEQDLHFCISESFMSENVNWCVFQSVYCCILYQYITCMTLLLHVTGSCVNITRCNETSSGTADWQSCSAVQHDRIPGSETVQPSSISRLW